MIYAENILICIAAPFLICLLFARGGVRRFGVAFLTGMVTCLLAAYISGFLRVKSGIEMEKAAIYLSPIVEECMKLVPILLYLMLFEPADQRLIGFALGGGVGFATLENCCYILTGGADKLSYILIRGMASGVMHIVSMLLLVSGIIVARRLGLFSASVLIGALAFSMSFHGLYNLLISGEGAYLVVGYGMPVVTAIILYLPYQNIFSKNGE